MIVLASTSVSRRGMLAAAGVPFEAVGSHVDEDAVKHAMAGAPVGDVAAALAAAKACAVSGRMPGRWVVGSDSMLALDGEGYLDKAGSLDGLRGQLRQLRGRTHQLISAVAVARDGAVAWACTDAATMRVRAFSEDFLEAYVAACGEAVMHSVGGYHLEGLGVQLFDRVDGDHFTVRGLPLVPLLGFLRQAGAIPA